MRFPVFRVVRSISSPSLFLVYAVFRVPCRSLFVQSRQRSLPQSSVIAYVTFLCLMSFAIRPGPGNFSVVTLPRALHRARTSRDSDLPLRDNSALSIDPSRCVVDECTSVPPVVPDLASSIAPSCSDSEPPMIVVRFSSTFPYVQKRLASHCAAAPGICWNRTFGEYPPAAPRARVH